VRRWSGPEQARADQQSRQESRRLLLARTWTVDLKGRNVRIHVLGPGAIDTAIQEGIPRRSWTPSSP
jgi:NAD(P)-dependent dehydrogenase (short-subunit alcohol dehydrogenase family)